LDFWRVDVVRNRELQFDVAKTLVGYYDVYVTCVKWPLLFGYYYRSVALYRTACTACRLSASLQRGTNHFLCISESHVGSTVHI